TRDEIGWGNLQPSREEWRWERFDHAINAMCDHDVHTVGLLAYAAPWAVKLRSDDGKSVITSLPDLEVRQWLRDIATG
ncbi:MAG: hypothetical protein QGH20_03325, partial [Candidatus Latescibacteria bacterium]|nr:hypothetical protein [Candidatus Latescibacterota bacterium]